MTHFDERSDLQGDDGEDPQGSWELEGDIQDPGELEGDEKEALRRDIHHDPWLIPGSPALQALSARIFQQIEDNSPRPPRQRKDATERRKAIVDNIVTSLTHMVLHHPEGTGIAVSARNDPTTRYDRPMFPREVFIQTIAEMETLALLLRHRGERGLRRTAIEPTPEFRLMVTREERPLEISREDGAETIILKASTGRGKPKVLIDYEDTPETEAMRAEMATINAGLNEADLRLADKRSPSPVFLTRRFQIDHPDAPHTFDRHGRLYNGFWINLPKIERHLLQVNGEAVVDLDFTGMFPQLAYLEAGLGLPNSDPYEGIKGLPRAAAKRGLSALLCRTGPMRRLPSELRELVGNDWNAERLSTALAERHPGIAHLFGTGVGLSLMYIESRILVVALLDLVRQGIPALPMHDGLMVAAPHEGAARRAMVLSSMKIVGVAMSVRKTAFRLK